MPNEPIPVPSALERFIEKLNLPEMIAGPAGKAISRLVAGATDIPAAYLDGFAQSIRDRTAAKKIVNQEVATAAAKLAASDTDIVARAAHSLLAGEFRKQKNKEAIARKTINELEKPSNLDDASKTNGADVDDDWLNVFERYAESASSERMQGLWARVLAGEIRKPSTYSLSTLRFVAELDSFTAALFEKYAPSVVAGDFIPYPEKQGQEFTDLMRLEEAGILTLAAGLLHKKYIAEGVCTFRYRTHHLILPLTAKVQWEIEAAILTRIGREIYELVQSKDDMAAIKRFVERLPKENITRIACLEMVVGARPTDLWVAPQQTS